MRSACFPAFGSAVLPLLFVFSAGCAPEKGGVEKQLSKLQDEVRHLQSETDRMGERLDAVEARRVASARDAAARDADERVANNAGTVTRPKLKVVRMEPGDDGTVDDVPETSAPAPEDDGGPRLLIQGEGKSIESRQLSGTAPVAAKSSKSESAKSRQADTAKSTNAPKSDAASAK
jgi:outer membrane murein-binding lipoprotein Lpp